MPQNDKDRARSNKSAGPGYNKPTESTAAKAKKPTTSGGEKPAQTESYKPYNMPFLVEEESESPIPPAPVQPSKTEWAELRKVRVKLAEKSLNIKTMKGKNISNPEIIKAKDKLKTLMTEYKKIPLVARYEAINSGSKKSLESLAEGDAEAAFKEMSDKRSETATLNVPEKWRAVMAA
ncbi:hypothetical protein LTR37_011620 [Vermiconidia calcicola]|uniref:Uncharacterized protein n=1 Tax=Vermiconidia calcicola TaxID=1690605 RepID=A0ACC3N1Z0_9PEZI|nr:hypothetical protein LTR37_011620 [Vermiconidia calcicola]